MSIAQDKLKVLLIEHDSGFARYVGEMLGQARDFTAEVLSAQDLPRALTALAGDSFDVVVMDMSLPDGAGLANVSLLRAEAPQLPVIVAGESDDEAVALEAVHAGAHDYLVKGQLTPSWLERSLRYSIERHRMDRACSRPRRSTTASLITWSRGSSKRLRTVVISWPTPRWRAFTGMPRPKS